jgi:hypothetical protein
VKSIILILSFILSVNIFANIDSPMKSIPSVEEVSWALESSRWDIEESIYFSFDEIEDPSKMNCESKDKSELIALFKIAIEKYSNYFPDEELPFKQALKELDQFLSGKVLEYCSMDLEEEKILQVYYNSNFLVSIGQ